MYLHRPKEEIVAIAFEYIPNPQGVRAVMLHGSRTDGRANAESDYDLAIICDRIEVDHMGFYREGVPYSCNFYPSEIVGAGKSPSPTFSEGPALFGILSMPGIAS